MEQYTLDAYDEVLQEVLEIPPLEYDASGAIRVVRCLLKPSFHPECSISVVERDSVDEMTIRVPTRSVWSFLNARSGSPHVNPVTDWVKPAVSTERVAMEAAAALWRSQVDEIERSAFSDGSASGLDGMSVDVVLWRSNIERSFSVRFGPFNGSDARHRLVRTVLEIASKVASWGQTMAALRNARSYLTV